jgi:hypothetical protein
MWGIKRPVAIGGPYWVLAGIDCRDQIPSRREISRIGTCSRLGAPPCPRLHDDEPP